MNAPSAPALLFLRPTGAASREPRQDTEHLENKPEHEAAFQPMSGNTAQPALRTKRRESPGKPILVMT